MIPEYYDVDQCIGGSIPELLEINQYQNLSQNAILMLKDPVRYRTPCHRNTHGSSLVRKYKCKSICHQATHAGPKRWQGVVDATVKMLTKTIMMSSDTARRIVVMCPGVLILCV